MGTDVNRDALRAGRVSPERVATLGDAIGRVPQVLFALSTALHKSSASGANASSSTAWAASTRSPVAGAQPAFPPASSLKSNASPAGCRGRSCPVAATMEPAAIGLWTEARCARHATEG